MTSGVDILRTCGEACSKLDAHIQDEPSRWRLWAWVKWKRKRDKLSGVLAYFQGAEARARLRREKRWEHLLQESYRG